MVCSDIEQVTSLRLGGPARPRRRETQKLPRTPRLFALRVVETNVDHAPSDPDCYNGEIPSAHSSIIANN